MTAKSVTPNAHLTLGHLNNDIARSLIPKRIVDETAAAEHAQQCGYFDGRKGHSAGPWSTAKCAELHRDRVALTLARALIVARDAGIDLRLLERRNGSEQ